MKLYLDDDIASVLLARLLRMAGHEVQRPAEVGMTGKDDPIHFAHAIGESRVVLSHNHRDFENLHNLVLTAQGRHPGILIVRKTTIPGVT